MGWLVAALLVPVVFCVVAVVVVFKATVVLMKALTVAAFLAVSVVSAPSAARGEVL
jgi:hypothetical protein